MIRYILQNLLNYSGILKWLKSITASWWLILARITEGTKLKETFFIFIFLSIGFICFLKKFEGEYIAPFGLAYASPLMPELPFAVEARMS